MTADGCYLLNCVKGDQRRSIVAYYSKFILGGGNDGQQPSDFVYCDTEDFILWEGSKKNVKFNSGVKFSWNIEADAQSKNQNVQVGTASNTFENWTVFKDDGKFMFTNSDGFDCSKIYYVN